MPDQRSGHDSKHKPRMHALGTAHHRTKGLTIVLLIKLLAIVAISALLWALQVKLEIGATAMVLLHLAPAAALGGGCAAERHVARATYMRVPEVPRRPPPVRGRRQRAGHAADPGSHGLGLQLQEAHRASRIQRFILILVAFPRLIPTTRPS